MDSVTIIPFFDSLGPSALEYVINQTELTTMCMDGGGFEHTLKAKANCPTLKNLVLYDDVTEEQKARGNELGLTIYTYNDVLEEGKKQTSVTFQEPVPDTIHMFCYTSGTTGDPKAAMIPHKAFIPTVVAIEYFGDVVTESDVCISYLPYAHIFEQCIFVISLFKGYGHGYYDGNPFKLLDDIKVLKPTFFCTVPRILTRVYQKIQGSLTEKSAFIQWLFNKGVNSKRYYLENQNDLKHKFYDSVVFKKVRAEFGGNLRSMITASAPISGDVL
mmetsp:Transcript_43353/g.41771  ORF Transcript_43353/g.41771 Transcript_43353/m.41771 type:complete len:273 (+) Transcript_43353:420-1238(+)